MSLQLVLRIAFAAFDAVYRTINEVQPKPIVVKLEAPDVAVAAPSRTAFEKHRDDRDDAALAVNIVTFIAVLLYAIVSLYQLVETRSEGIAARRPYVLVSVGKIVIGTAKVTADVYFTNFGASPAVHFSSSVHFVDSRIIDEQFREIDAGTLGPPPDEQSVTTIPPGGKDNAPYATFSHGFDPSQLASIKNSDGDYAFIARVKYGDLAGKAYYTDFCVQLLKSGAQLNCSKHNEAQ